MFLLLLIPKLLLLLLLLVMIYNIIVRFEHFVYAIVIAMIISITSTLFEGIVIINGILMK